MGFIGELLEEVVGGGGGNDRRDEGPVDPPYVQPPWATRWDDEAGRWIFINEQTGERSFERPIFEEAGEFTCELCASTAAQMVWRDC